MANYSIASKTGGEVGAYNKTLVASTIDQVSFDTRESVVEIISDGTADIFGTTDGSTPTVNGPQCFIIPAGGVIVRELSPRGSGTTVIKLISSGTPKYSVARVL